MNLLLQMSIMPLAVAICTLGKLNVPAFPSRIRWPFFSRLFARACHAIGCSITSFAAILIPRMLAIRVKIFLMRSSVDRPEHSAAVRRTPERVTVLYALSTLLNSVPGVDDGSVEGTYCANELTIVFAPVPPVYSP